jgi:antitoxin (DNA-binding transcriptional repressor) of toxin-antitoxin stability system
MDEREFADQCLSLIDEVHESGIEVIITRSGIPIVRLIRYTPSKPKAKDRRTR